MKQRVLVQEHFLKIVKGCLFLLFLTGPLRASSFDDDVMSIKGPPHPERRDAVKRLKQGGPDAVTAIVRGLHNADPNAKKHLLRLLSQIRSSNKKMAARDGDAIELAKQAREEKDPSVHIDMIDGLVDIGGPSAIRELEKFAAEESDERIRLATTHSVANLTETETAFFKKQTKDPSRMVQLEAFYDLTRAGDNSGRDVALKTLKESTNEFERQYSISLLGEVGDPRDKGLLESLSAKASEFYVCRNSAQEALKNIELLQQPREARLSFLLTSLDDESVLIREWAYVKLSRWKDTSTSARLKLYLAEPGHKGYQEAANALSNR